MPSAPAEKQGLFDKGAAAAQKFLTTWDFDAWKQAYSQVSVPA